MSLAIVSGGQRALILGDVAVHPAQITETAGPMTTASTTTNNTESVVNTDDNPDDF